MFLGGAMKVVNLEEYIRVGGGRWGESFNHRENPDIMMKLYAPQQKQMALDEYDRAQKVYGLGIPTPEPGEIVEAPDGRLGMVFRRIPDKKSFARAIGENPEEAENLAARFASMCKELHATSVPEGMFPSVREKYRDIVKDFPFLPSDVKDGIIRFIYSMPDSHTALHGDLHFGNVIFSGDKAWFIDLGEFGYGYPMFDFGMAMMAMKCMREEIMKDMFHTDKPTAIRFWQAFLQAYFGKDCRVDALEEEILPFVALRAIYMESMEERIVPPFHKIIRETIEKGYWSVKNKTVQIIPNGEN